MDKWPETRRLWLDLARGILGTGTPGVKLPAARQLQAGAYELLYLPPVEEGLHGRRRALVEDLATRGQPLLVHCFPDLLTTSGAGVELVVDLSETLIARRLEGLESLERAAAAVWPLIPGVTDTPTLWEEGCRCLAAAGLGCVQPIAPKLSPRMRRRLAERLGKDREESVFHALFHARRRSEREFARIAASHGLRCFFRRGASGRDRAARNLELAELLALGAELWLRLGRSEARGQELYRASRWVEKSATDVRALVREGNLGVLDWLQEPAETVMREWALTGESASVESWIREYTGP